MGRLITAVVIFFLAMNLFAQMFISTGVAATVGLDANVGGGDIRENAENLEEVSSGTESGNTLFGLYNVLSIQLGDFFSSIYPGLNMLGRAGVPYFIINFLGTMFSALIGIAGISFLRGYDL